jgi:hypothetical protein
MKHYTSIIIGTQNMSKSQAEKYINEVSFQFELHKNENDNFIILKDISSMNVDIQYLGAVTSKQNAYFYYEIDTQGMSRTQSNEYINNIRENHMVLYHVDINQKAFYIKSNMTRIKLVVY